MQELILRSTIHFKIQKPNLQILEIQLSQFAVDRAELEAVKGNSMHVIIYTTLYESE